MNTVDVHTAHKWLMNKDAIMIDVRENDEYQEWRIDGVYHSPLSNLPLSIQAIDLPKDTKIIFQCLKGGRSAQAIEFLQENILKGHEHVYNLEGGIAVWESEGLPVIKTSF